MKDVNDTNLEIIGRLTIQFDCRKRLVLLQQMSGVSSQQLVDLLDVVLLGQLDSVVPLVQLDANVDGVLHAVAFRKRRHLSVRGKNEIATSVCKRWKTRYPLLCKR